MSKPRLKLIGCYRSGPKLGDAYLRIFRGWTLLNSSVGDCVVNRNSYFKPLPNKGVLEFEIIYGRGPQ